MEDKMTRTQLLRELYLIQHGGHKGSLDHHARFQTYCEFLINQGLTHRQVIDLLLLATTHILWICRTPALIHCPSKLRTYC
jgi:hypothetical protein